MTAPGEDGRPAGPEPAGGETVEGGPRTVDPKLLEMLACPLTKGPLVWNRETSELVCRAARLAYPVREGVPIMLPSEARRLEDGEADPLR